MLVIAIATFADAAPPPEPVRAECRNPPTLERALGPGAGDLVVGLGGAAPIDCESSGSAMPLPPSVTLAIAPNPVFVRSGHDGSAQLVIENGSAADVELYLDDENDRLTSPDHEIDDGSGKRVDVVYRDVACNNVFDITRQRSLHIRLSAHRFTTVPFDVRAIASHYDNACDKTDSPLRAGRYTLVLHTPLGDVRGRLVVR